MKIKTILTILAASVIVLILAFAVIMGIGVYQYMEAVPEITVNGPIHAVTGSTLHISELADIETEKVRSMKIWISSDSTLLENTAVSDDQQSLYVGDSAGSFEVTISASGENAEHREAVVTIIVTDPE